jgi:hypothetical protein
MAELATGEFKRIGQSHYYHSACAEGKPVRAYLVVYVGRIKKIQKPQDPCCHCTQPAHTCFDHEEQISLGMIHESHMDRVILAHA